MNAEVLPIRTAAESGLAQEFDRYFRAFVTDAKELALREAAEEESEKRLKQGEAAAAPAPKPVDVKAE